MLWISGLLIFFPLLADRVVLTNGAIFEGTILSEDEKSLELQVEKGQTLTFEKKSIARIERDPNKETVPEKKQAVTAPRFQSFDEHFMLRNREGKHIGNLRSQMREDLEGDTPILRLEESFTFFEGEKNFRVHWVEIVGVDFTPRELLYREEGSSEGRVVLARVEGEQLKIEVSGGPEKRKLVLPWDKDSRFPLSLYSQIRERATREQSSWTGKIFQATSLQMETHRLEFGSRVTQEGSATESWPYLIRDCAETVCSEAWLHTNQGLVKRQWNGKELEAFRSKPEELRRPEHSPR